LVTRSWLGWDSTSDQELPDIVGGQCRILDYFQYEIDYNLGFAISDFVSEHRPHPSYFVQKSLPVSKGNSFSLTFDFSLSKEKMDA
jgi:hypothetical protein